MSYKSTDKSNWCQEYVMLMHTVSFIGIVILDTRVAFDKFYKDIRLKFVAMVKI